MNIMPARSGSPKGSLGLKLMLVCVLVVLMAIPAMFISHVSFERSNRADEVTREVSQRYGGKQYLTGPILVAPYYKTGLDGKINETGEYAIFAETGRADFTRISTEIRERSLFKVPIYKAVGELSAKFGRLDKAVHEKGRTVQWDQARILIGLSDGRGLADDIFLTTGAGNRLKFEPASHRSEPIQVPKVTRAVEAAIEAVAAETQPVVTYEKKLRQYDGLVSRIPTTFLSVPAGALITEDAEFNVAAKIHIGGATELGIYPFAKSTQVEMVSDWPSPGFKGGFAPQDREITAEGFQAQWSVPYLARGVLGAGESHHINLFDPHNKAMTTQFVAEVSPYQTVNRALKYAVLFIGLVFMTFFLFEVLLGVRVHPAQYLLIGLAQAIFYLLLLALSEHLGFVLAFFTAAGATIGLTGAYAGAVLKSRAYGLRAGLIFAMTYALLFALMRMQDFALLIGALASFLTIALIMYLTRDLDWYGGSRRGLDQAETFKTSPAK